MSTYQALSAPSSLTAHDSYSQWQVELIWAMGLASLESNDGELVLPQSMEGSLTECQINDLKLRLSQHIGAPTNAFRDRHAQVFRIMRASALTNAENPLTHSPTQQNSNFSRRSSRVLLRSSTRTYKAKAAHALKARAKVPRPPNAFILYRKERHPVLKSEHPDYHNNDISVILGKKWRSEPDSVKARYRKLAEEIKAKHKQDHPDYQYAPRKASEKKRRITAHRAAELARARGDREISLMEFGNGEGASEASPPTREDVIDTRRPHINQFVPDDDANISFTLPSYNTQNLHDMMNTNSGLPFDPTHHFQLSSTIPDYVLNDQDFVSSLVDWDGIAADAAFVRDATEDLVHVELGDSVSLTDEGQRCRFETELA